MIARDDFYVSNRLAAQYILGCTFFDRFLAVIISSDKRVLIQDGQFELIICKALGAPEQSKKYNPRNHPSDFIEYI